MIDTIIYMEDDITDQYCYECSMETEHENGYCVVCEAMNRGPVDAAIENDLDKMIHPEQ